MNTDCKSITNYDKRELASDWMTCECIRFGEFKLKLHEKNPDAPLSPFYINFRRLRSNVILNSKTATAMKYLIRDNKIKHDYIADVPTAITPTATLISTDTMKPLVSPRKESKKYGSGDSVDGIYLPDRTVVLVDDIITRADSKLEAIRKLEDVGLKVSALVTLVDRKQGGSDILKDKGYSVFSLFTIRELLDLYLDMKTLSREDYKRCTNYLDLYS